MPLAEPSWWYKRPALAARLLTPAAQVYDWVARTRAARETALDVGVPVVCIGNFTAGGTGKTPLALTVFAICQSLQQRPIFLSRGYGGRRTGPHLVDPDTDLARDVGDEPLLLARRGPTVIARDRRAGARCAAAHSSRPTVIIMDDGLQNPSLAKSLSIAVVDGARGIGNGRVIPAGPLRAALARQVRLADAIVVNHAPDTSAQKTALDGVLATFDGPVLSARAQAVGDAAWLGGGPLVAYAGIGNPQRFFAMLGALGGDIVAAHAFRDHHPYDERDAHKLIDQARRLGASLVTTEKDLARLAGSAGARGELAALSHPLRIALALEPADRARLTTLLTLALHRPGTLA